MGRHASRPARAHPSSRRRPDRGAGRCDRRNADPRTGQAGSRREEGDPVRRRGDPLLRRGRTPPRRVDPAIVAARHPQSRLDGASRRGGRHRAVELPRRPLCLEGRAGARGRLHAGRQAAARNAAGDRSGRRVLRRGRPAGRRAQRPAGNRPRGGRRTGRASRHPDDLGHRVGTGRTVDHARGRIQPEAAVAGTRRPMPVHRARRRRPAGGSRRRGAALVLQHGADLHRGEPDPRLTRHPRGVRRGAGGGDTQDQARPRR